MTPPEQKEVEKNSGEKKSLFVFTKKINPRLEKFIKISVLFFIILPSLLLSFEYFPRDAFALGIKIGSEDAGGLSKQEAKEKLLKKTGEFLEKDITFSFSKETNSKAKKVKMKDIGINFDIGKSLEEPFKVGKKEGYKFFFENLKEKFGALQKRYNFPLYSNFSEQKFENFLTENFGEFESLPKNAMVAFNEKTGDFEIKEPEDGLLFPKQEIKEEIKKEAGFLKINDIYLSVEKTPPEIGKEEAGKSANQSKEIIELCPYLLFAEEKGFVLNKETLGNWLVFLPKKLENQTVSLEVSLDENLVKNYLDKISESINIEPQNLKLSFEQGEIKMTSASKKGKVLKIDENAKEIEEKILKKEKKISLLTEDIEPKINEEKIKELSIEKLIGSGVSNFAGSPKNRIHNIKTATSRFNGVLIEPGKTFSFNETLGEVGPEQGYLPELVIKKDKTVPEYGGGVCQVSTTMFRTSVNSGMEIIERKPHAYPVKYYNPQGFDATIYPPSPDLKFKNNTDGFILIQSKIEGNNLTFEFYGKDDGRKVVVKGPYQYDIKEDGSMKARLEEEVWKNGEIFYKKTFLSSYNSPKSYPVEKNPLE